MPRLLRVIVWSSALVAACAASDRRPADLLPDGAPLDAGTIDTPVSPPPGSGAHVRLVTGNLSTGNLQSYEAPGIRIFRGLAADVAMIQEFNVASSSAADVRGFVDQAFGPAYTYVRGAAGQQIPNGIVSRFPIIASGEWIDTEVANRAFVWAQIDVPGSVDLFAISVHLLTSSAGERDIEAGELVQHIRDLPAGAYVVLGGDFNSGSRGEACITTLSQALITTGPYPVDQNNVGETNAARARPYDWVLGNLALQRLETPVAIGQFQFAHGFVADTRSYQPIADLAPAMSDDSNASMMQHMAVVRDFALP